VRTDLGELKWVEYRASDYTALEQHGRAVYIREGCWYCHSQYVRPVTARHVLGPVTQAGEYALTAAPVLHTADRPGPVARGTQVQRRLALGALLERALAVPDSIMPRFAALFDGPYSARILTDKDGNRTLERTAVTERLFDFENGRKIALTPNADGLLYVAERGKYPVILTPNHEFTAPPSACSATRRICVDWSLPAEARNDRGKWRDRFEPQRLDASRVGIPRSEEWIEHGKEVYRRRCLGCPRRDRRRQRTRGGVHPDGPAA